MPQTVLVEDLETGMILVEPIVNNFGQTLLPSGIELNEKHVKILKTWNVKSITVKSDAAEEEIEISEELKALAEERLSPKMRWKPTNNIEKDLYNMGIIHTARELLSNKQ